MRQAVIDLIALGPLPSSKSATVEILKLYEEYLKSILRPLTDDEARALVSLYGPETDDDDCFGLCWTVLHLIETAPGWPLLDCLENPQNEWVSDLRARSERADLI